MLALRKRLVADGVVLVDYTVPAPPLLGEFLIEIGYGPERMMGALTVSPGRKLEATIEVVEAPEMDDDS